MDINRLCPGCMREMGAAQDAGIQEGDMPSAGERKGVQNAKMRAAGIHADEAARHMKEPGKAQDPKKCPYCGFCADTYKQNARCLPLYTILAGKYLVGAVLGEGGFGITYIGYDLNMQTRIAIKEYFPVELVSRDTTSMTGDRVISMSGDKSATYKQGLKKYVAEAQNVSQFSEIPGVVSVKDFFYENETAYIVMEYIDGISLKDYLKERGGRLSEEESLAIMKPVLEALVKVHEAGIVHRDISPDNIMLMFRGGRGSGNIGGYRAVTGNGESAAVRTAHGESGASDMAVKGDGAASDIASVKLIDFGAARTTARNDQKSLTIILKHGYAPEEQYRTHGEQGPWTDVYAVCAVLYRMLTGQTPVPAMDRMFQDELKSFDDLNTKASRNTQVAILKGLAVKKEDRIQSIEELMQFLYENKKLFLHGQRNGRRTAAIAAIAAAAGAAILGIAVFIGVGRDRRQERENLSDKRSLEAGQTTGSEEMPAPALAESRESAEESGTAAYPAENIVEFEDEQLGETIAFPDSQTSISVGNCGHVLMRLPDGSVEARGANNYGQCMVENWGDIVAVSAGNYHSLGLRSDGKVFAVGDNSSGQCEVETWEEVVQVAAGGSSSYGLTKDGRILVCGNNRAGAMDEVIQWENMVAITAGLNDGLIGLDRDGNVYFAGGEEDWPVISDWQGVAHLAYSFPFLIGMKEDGTVVNANASAEEYSGYLEGIEDLSGMRQICLRAPVLGIREDGTVAYINIEDERVRTELEQWTEMEAVASLGVGDRINIVGMGKDGEIREYRQCYGNSAPEEMRNLEWVQAMTINGNVNLVAGTKDGKLLTYGTEPFRMDDLSGLYDGSQAPGSPAVGIVGMDALLLEDGRVFLCGRFTGERENPYIGGNAVQALEVYDRGASTYVYALLTEDGKVQIEVVGDADIWAHEIQPILDAETWEDVVQIGAADRVLYGLHKDGSVSTTGHGIGNFPASDFVRIACGGEEIIGIKADGTAEVIRADEYAVASGRTQIDSWTNLVDVAIGESHVVGLRADGTVVAAGSNHMNQCDVEDWTDIVSITVGKNCTLGITTSGELRMAGGLY